MKIAVNTRLLLKGRLEGIGWFTYENFRRITKDHPEHQFYFFFDRPYDNEFIFSDNVTPVILYPQARHPILYHLYFNISVKRALKKLKIDLFISTDGYMPLKPGIKTLNIFHDLNFEYYPQDIPSHDRWYYRKYFPKFAKAADRIATVSEYSKQDISKLYNIDPAIIDVVYNGANEIYSPVTEEVKSTVRKNLTGGIPFFYFIGSLHPRKNLVNLFKAYDLYRNSTNNSSAKLVITGAKMWWTKDIDAVYNSMKCKNDVIFTGRLEQAVIRDTMASALALTYVSYFEGFGIPIIEAFRCGTPVITSNVTSMPEVADNAALLVDPFSPEAIADAMISIDNNPALASDLIKKGFIRANEFTWNKSASRLWKSIERLLF